MRNVACFMVSALVFALAATALGEGPAGGIAGRVTDESNSALPGVTVELEGPLMPAVRVASTDRGGSYEFTGLRAGTYQISFKLLNFVGATRRGVTVEAGKVQRSDAALHLSVSADVVVTGKKTFRNLAEVSDPGESLIGIANASTEGAVTARQVELRPILHAADVLEAIPGLVVSQHSGEGKANQYYLRGFNLDHGTDFATTVAGMPVNLPTHAHGHGWTDLNFLIPELVSGIQYRKGPYFVEDGDFTTAGSANVNYANALDETIAHVEGGSNDYARVLLAGSPKFGDGTLLYGLEVNYNNGPWKRPDNYRKYNGVLRYSLGDSQNGLSVTGMGYQARWNSTDQVAERAVTSGLISRFGTQDPSDGGESHRYSLSGEYQRSGEESVTHATVYAIDSKLNLYSNFTYFLDNPVDGDQFEQVDDRNIYGFKLTHRWFSTLFGRPLENEGGVQGRFDDIHRDALFSTKGRVRLSTTRDDQVRQYSGAAFFQSDVQWASKFRTILGVRGDLYRFDVRAGDPLNSGVATNGIFSPKLAMIFGPFNGTEIYANAGFGFHSNDARGATITVDPKTGDPVQKVTPLARAKSAEIGVRSIIVPHLQTTLALWGLDIGSELVFSGDAGNTQASRPSRRYGVEWSNFYRPARWLTVDADLSLSKAQFRVDDPIGNSIPGAVQTVFASGLSVDNLGQTFGSLRFRYFGPRSLIEDDSVRSKATTTVNALLGYRFTQGLRAQLEVLNVLDAKVSEIDYFYTSRLQGEPAQGVDDIHFHPTSPRAARFSIAYGF